MSLGPEQTIDEPVSKSLARLERELGRLVHRLDKVQLKNATGDETTQLERSSYLILRILHDAGPLRLSALAAQLGLDNSTVSRQVHVLKDHGLVERIDDPEDGRAFLLKVSETGGERFRQTRNSRRSVLLARLNEWDAQDLTDLARLLGKYNDSMTYETPKETSA
jgi:DNA-binding MarR family transcriptional regulator